MKTQFQRNDVVRFKENQFDGFKGVVEGEIRGSRWVIVHVNNMPVFVEKNAVVK